MSGSLSTPSGYFPEGWVHWPDHPELSFQFARALGAAQVGAASVSECFLAASKMTPGDTEAWHREWQKLGARHEESAIDAGYRGRLATARASWLRAANYYRCSEFYLAKDDPRRMKTFDKIEACSHRYLALMKPAGEVVKVPYENGAHMDAYFLRAPTQKGPGPVVICFGGLDEYKDEQLHDLTQHAFARGMSLLLVELPGQGGTLRRQGLVNRFDTEVPVGRCVDYLLTRSDVDPTRIALYGASMGGYYAARAASFEHRIVAVVSDAIMFDLHQTSVKRAKEKPNALIWMHLKWVYGCETIEQILEKSKMFRLEGVINNIKVPFLILHGEADYLGVWPATDAYEYAKANGVKVELKLFSPEETGASHCQVDNPTIGMEYVFDWLGEKLGIDERSLT